MPMSGSGHPNPTYTSSIEDPFEDCPDNVSLNIPMSNTSTKHNDIVQSLLHVASISETPQELSISLPCAEGPAAFSKLTTTAFSTRQGGTSEVAQQNKLSIPDVFDFDQFVEAAGAMYEKECEAQNKNYI